MQRILSGIEMRENVEVSSKGFGKCAAFFFIMLKVWFYSDILMNYNLLLIPTKNQVKENFTNSTPNRKRLGIQVGRCCDALEDYIL